MNVIRRKNVHKLYSFLLAFFVVAFISYFYLIDSSDEGKLAPLAKNIDVVQSYKVYSLGKIHNIKIKDQLAEVKLSEQQAEAKKAAEEVEKKKVAEEAEKKKAAEAEAKKQADFKKAQQAALASAAVKSSTTKASTAAPSIAAPAPIPTLIDVLPLGASKQAILILGSSTSSEYAKCEVYEKIDNLWSKKWTFNSVVGRNGMSANRHEGDKTTPMGIFGFLFQFGSAPNPGVNMEYRQTSPGDLWTSNPNNIDEYNTWIHYTGTDANARFYDFEDLYATSVYKYAAVIDFNYGPGKIIGKGSGIFMHISPYSGRGTLGCVGLPEQNLLQVLRWMDPAEKPRIAIGTENYLRGLK